MKTWLRAVGCVGVLTAIHGSVAAAQTTGPATRPARQRGTPGQSMDYGPFLSYSVTRPRPPATPRSSTRPSTRAATRAAAATSRPARSVASAGDTANRRAATQPGTRPARPAQPQLVAAKGITIKVGPQASVCFDADLMRMSAGWTGGFLNLAHTNIGEYKGDLPAGEDGVTQFYTPTVAGWARGSDELIDPRPDHEGPLARERAHYKGLYRNGQRVVLSYSVGDVDVLEMPGTFQFNGHTVFTRTIRVDKSAARDDWMNLLIAEAHPPKPGSDGATSEKAPAQGANLAVCLDGDAVLAVGVVALPQGAKLEIDHSADPMQRIILRLPAPREAATFKVIVGRIPEIDVLAFRQMLTQIGEPEDLPALCHGGPALWKQDVVTRGVRAADNAPYVLDTVQLPDDNPWGCWIRPGAFDFFPDGRAALCTMNGDVWIVSNLDDKLDHVTWKRFASGLYEALGLKIVDGTIYVLGRDQITRLHDLNGDGEADFYENFINDFVTLPVYHAFALDLQTDREGNFYTARGGNWVKPGERMHACLFKISKDGKHIETYATGLRAPNGLMVGPDDQTTVSDNQGHWTPSSRFNFVKRGGFYGFVIDPRQVNKDNAALVHTPSSYEPPMCWLPMNVDNSSGGQVWVTSDKWGPLKGNLLLLSYGKCTVLEAMTEEVEGVMQGGAVTIPVKCDSGIMRGRFNPADGQLYVCGLKGWQTDAARDGCFQRLRYTGKPVNMPSSLHVVPHGIRIGFTAPLDPESAGDEQSYGIEQWNYKWTSTYGSPDVKVSDPSATGHDEVMIKSAKVSEDHKSVTLEIPGLQPVMQMSIEMQIESADGAKMHWTIYNTINRIPKS